MRIYARFACPMLIKRKNNPLNIRKFEIKSLNLQPIIYSIPPLTKRTCPLSRTSYQEVHIILGRNVDGNKAKIGLCQTWNQNSGNGRGMSPADSRAAPWRGWDMWGRWFQSLERLIQTSIRRLLGNGGEKMASSPAQFPCNLKRLNRMVSYKNEPDRP